MKPVDVGSNPSASANLSSLRKSMPNTKVNYEWTCATCNGVGKFVSGPRAGEDCFVCLGVGIHRGKRQLLRCIGGPHDATFRIAEQSPDYVRYNVAKSRNVDENFDTSVLIHRTIVL